MRLYWLLVTSFFAFVLMSCAISNTTPMVETSRPGLTATLLATNIPTQIENSTPTTSPSKEEGQKLVQKLLEDNGGCKLPCWWGIMPGKTTWVEARKILEKVSLFVGGQESENDFDANVNAYLPYPHGFATYMEHLYGVNNGIVEYIRVYNFDLAPNYFLPNLLESYGQPDEIWIRTFSKAERGIQNYTVDVFYKEMGILVEYSTGEPLKEIDGKLQNCLIKEMDSPFLHLWSPETQELSFHEAKKFIDTTNLPDPKPLLEATGMDVETFYETFRNTATDACLETPKELWPQIRCAIANR